MAEVQSIPESTINPLVLRSLYNIYRDTYEAKRLSSALVAAIFCRNKISVVLFRLHFREQIAKKYHGHTVYKKEYIKQSMNSFEKESETINLFQNTTHKLIRNKLYKRQNKDKPCLRNEFLNLKSVSLSVMPLITIYQQSITIRLD